MDSYEWIREQGISADFKLSLELPPCSQSHLILSTFGILSIRFSFQLHSTENCSILTSHPFSFSLLLLGSRKWIILRGDIYLVSRTTLLISLMILMDPMNQLMATRRKRCLNPFPPNLPSFIPQTRYSSLYYPL